LAVGVETVAYRPRRRAVFRYRLLSRRGGRTVFGKVVRGTRAERWRALSDAGRHSRGPVRLSLPFARLDDRTMLVDPLPGTSLRELLLRGEPLPSAERIAGLVRLPEALPVAAGSRRPDAVTVAERAAGLLTRLVPESELQIRRVEEAVHREAGREPTLIRPVHGDLYEAQVYVADDFSLGLIDLDDVGSGDPAMDAANFCAHLLALALSAPQAAGRLLAHRVLVRRAFAGALGIPESALEWREALAMLLLATGPFRVADPRWPQGVRRRVDLAVRLMGGDQGGP
jgi:hypothetical protein